MSTNVYGCPVERHVHTIYLYGDGAGRALFLPFEEVEPYHLFAAEEVELCFCRWK